jgi:hypothetical protein
MPKYQASKMTVVYNNEDITRHVLNNMGDQAKLRSLPADKCAFCGVDLAHFLSAGLTAVYAGLEFCTETCLNSWIDGQAKE